MATCTGNLPASSEYQTQYYIQVISMWQVNHTNIWLLPTGVMIPMWQYTQTSSHMQQQLISIILCARLPTTYGLYITDMYTNTASLDNLLSSQVMCTNILSSAVIIHHHHQGARFLITYLQVKPIWQVTHTNTLPSAAITYYHQGARFDNIPTGETYLTGNTHKHFAICSNNLLSSGC